MFNNDTVENFGYVLFIFGICLVWYQFGWLNAITTGVLIYSVILIIGSFITVTAKWLYKKFDERLGCDKE